MLRFSSRHGEPQSREYNRSRRARAKPQMSSRHISLNTNCVQASRASQRKVASLYSSKTSLNKARPPCLSLTRLRPPPHVCRCSPRERFHCDRRRSFAVSTAVTAFIATRGRLEGSSQVTVGRLFLAFIPVHNRNVVSSRSSHCLGDSVLPLRQKDPSQRGQQVFDVPCPNCESTRASSTGPKRCRAHLHVSVP